MIEYYRGGLIKKKAFRDKIEVRAVMSTQLYEEIMLSMNLSAIPTTGGYSFTTLIGMYTDKIGCVICYSFMVEEFKTLYDKGELFTVYEAAIRVFKLTAPLNLNLVRKSIQSMLGIKNVIIRLSEMA